MMIILLLTSALSYYACSHFGGTTEVPEQTNHGKLKVNGYDIVMKLCHCIYYGRRLVPYYYSVGLTKASCPNF